MTKLYFIFIALCISHNAFGQSNAEQEITKFLIAKDTSSALAATKKIWEKAASDPSEATLAATREALWVWGRSLVGQNNRWADSLISILPDMDMSTTMIPQNHGICQDGIDKVLLAIADDAAKRNPMNATFIYQQLATSCYYTQLYDSIAPRYLRAEVALELIPNDSFRQESATSLYRQLFYLYWGNLRNYEMAETYLHKMAKTSQNANSHFLFSALLYDAKGDYDRALEYAEKLTNNDPTTTAQIAIIRANAYLAQNQLTKFRQVIQTATSNDNQLEHLVILDIKHALLTNSTPIIPNYHNNGNRAEPYIRLFHISKAVTPTTPQEHKDYYRTQIANTTAKLAQSRALPETSEGYLCVAQAYAILGDKGLAKNYYDTALAVLSGAPVGQLQIDNIKDNYTLLSILQGQLECDITPDAKQKFSDAALLTLTKIRQQLTSRGAKEIALNKAPFFFDAALSLAAQQYQNNKTPQNFQLALNISNQSKSILLLESLKENEALTFGGVPDSIRQLEKSLSSDIALYEAESHRAQTIGDTSKYNLYRGFLLEKRQHLADLKSTLEKNYPKYYQIKHKETQISLDAIQNALPDQETALIEVFASNNQLSIFSITKNHFHLASNPLPKNYNQLLTQYYKLLTSPQLYSDNPIENQKQIAAVGYQIYSLLLAESLAKLPQGTRRIIFIADGILNYIPIDALPTDMPAADADFKNTQFLLHKYAVSYHYSPALWLESTQTKKNKAPNQAILALAPTYAPDKTNPNRPTQINQTRRFLKELTGTKKEVAYLEKTFEHGLYLYDQAASEAQFKKEAHQYAILHLAMHGLVDQNNPMYSAMVFSETNDTTQDNFLHAYELQNMQLNADLVVLSACETGYGKYQNGEGVISIGRGFMYAGTPALVMSLWPINDQSTALIMQYFYENLQKNMPSDIAMQQAKISYLKSQSGLALHPNFWSAFVVVGNAQPVNLNQINYWFWITTGAAALFLVAVIAMYFQRQKS